jgi:hypothetical protein
MRTKFSRTRWTWTTSGGIDIDIDARLVHELESGRFIVAERLPGNAWGTAAVSHVWEFPGPKPETLRAVSLEALALCGAATYEKRWSAVKRAAKIYQLEWRKKSERRASK